jgi:hypothetical protein
MSCCDVCVADMIDATAAELESAKAEAAIKTSDLQALSAVLSQAEEQYAAAAAAAAATEAAASDKISKLEVKVSLRVFAKYQIFFCSIFLLPVIIRFLLLNSCLRHTLPTFHLNSRRRQIILPKPQLRLLRFPLLLMKLKEIYSPSLSKLLNCS